ncbi:MAG TPA: hypothetical protein VLL77_03190 [Anaerolineales bacterium]|nr:hypothetical protein [Anaerolineales bacterium]
MRRSRLFALLFTAAIVAGACTSAPPAPADEDAARQLMMEFFSLLHNGEYERAAALYGGSYDELSSKNPDTDPADGAGLFRNGCTLNGYRCLKVLEAEPTDSTGVDDFTFTVRFQSDDGTPFVLGPCCGATATEQPPVEVFRVVVHRAEDGSFLVMTLPVYVP